MKRKTLLISIFLFLLLPSIVKAKEATISLEGNNEVYASEQLEIDILAKDIIGSNLMTIGGSVTSSNSDCFFISSIKMLSSGIAKGDKFAYSNGDGIKEDTPIARISLVAKNNTCSANLSLTDLKLAFTDGTKLALPNVTKNINVLNLEDIKISKEKLYLKVNDTVKLNLYTPVSFPINNNLITWKSQNTNIASIDNLGTVKALKKGETSISATYQGKILTSNIEVVDFLKGDLNRDEKIDLSDVLIALRIQMGLTKVNDYYLETGDINGNNIIDLTDVLYILRAQMKLV